jgi:hemoglobin
MGRMDLSNPPFALIGGETVVRALAEAFYDTMERDEPELTAVHTRDPGGKIASDTRARFALFLIGWLGGPQHYMERHGHPRLRMRHAHVPVGVNLRDAWLRTMQKAMDQVGVQGEVRRHLDVRFAEVADFLRNVEEG